MARTLTPEDFASYLTSLPPGQDIVGETWGTTHCPVAEYLQVRGYNYASVASRTIIVERPGKRQRYIRTPRWARYFISAIDTGRRIHSPVTRWDAVRALKQVLSDTGRTDLADTL